MRNQLNPLSLRACQHEHRHTHASLTLAVRISGSRPNRLRIQKKKKKRFRVFKRCFGVNSYDFGWGVGACFSARCSSSSLLSYLYKQGWSANGRAGRAAGENRAGLTGSWPVADGKSGGSCPAIAPRMYSSPPAICELSVYTLVMLTSYSSGVVTHSPSRYLCLALMQVLKQLAATCRILISYLTLIIYINIYTKFAVVCFLKGMLW